MAIVTRAAKGSALTYAEVDGNFLTPVTVGSTAIQLGETSTTLAGLESVTLTQDPTSALQVATKQYVDAVAEGLHVHASCACATTGTLASITGGSVTYDNGTAGVGATLTLSVALNALDGYTLQNGDRVLVKNEATQANNGIYTWATGGTVLTRAADFNTASEIASGDFTFVTYGTQYATSGWVQTTQMVTVGTTPITWSQFSGAGTYTAGTGLDLVGNQFSLITPVTAVLGGTGQTGYANGDILYASGTTALSKLGIGTSNQVLTSSGTAPQWSSSLSLTTITTSQDITVNTVDIGLGNNSIAGNLAVGTNALANAVFPGEQNTAIGENALTLNTTGFRNVAIGSNALTSNLTGNLNVAIGQYALGSNVSGVGNIAVGWAAGYGVTGSGNVAFGSESLSFSTGSDQIAIGAAALYAHENGDYNITIGSSAMYNTVNAANNICIGYSSGYNIEGGNSNTFVGYNTGQVNVAGDNNTLIGSNADQDTGATNLSYATAIGAGSKVATSSTIVLGRTSDTTVIGYTGIQTGRTELLQVGGAAFFAGGISGGTF